jgi:serine/threonine protein kinase
VGPVTDRPSTDGKLLGGAPNDPVPFGKYFLLGLIARGGMAEVYRARLREDTARQPRLLAIKVMRPQLAREARFVDMFHREGQLALLLRNRGIVETIEIGKIEGRHYIAMEYIGGRDLTQVLRRCQKSNLRIPVPHAVYIAARIAEGLDFGIAQALMKFTSEIGVLKGKFSYMSPEQIRGMPLDARTDVFSTGIILHEMLTTEKLFRGDTEFALMEKVRKAEVPPPSRFNRRVTPELDAIVLKALARDVADRYQSGAQFAADLNKLLIGYNFKPSELQEFNRGLFRADFQKEVADVESCRTSLPVDERPIPSSTPEMQPLVTPPPQPLPAPAPPPPVAIQNAPTPPVITTVPTPVAVPTVQPTPQQVEAAAAEKKGFFSKLFGKK